MKEQRSVQERDATILILLCAAVYAAAYVGRYSYTASMVGVMEATGAPKDEAGMVSTFFYFTYGIGQLVNAFLCRRYKVRPVIAGILLVSLAANAAASFLQNPLWIRWVWLLNGAAQSALWCTLIELLSRKIPIEKKGRAIFAMSTTLAIGTTAAYSVAALSIAAGHVFWTFRAASIVLGAMVVIWLLGTRRLSRMPDAGVPARPAEAAGKAPVSQKAVLLGSLGAILTGGVLAIGNGFLRDTLVTWTPSLLFEHFGLPESASVIITLILPLISVCGSLLVVTLHRRIRTYTILEGILYAVSTAALAGLLGAYRAHLTLAVILCAALNACLMAGINNVITSMIPLERAEGAGLFAGVMDAFCYVGNTLSGFLPGILLERYGYGVLLTMLPVCALFFTLFAFLISRRKA